MYIYVLSIITFPHSITTRYPNVRSISQTLTPQDYTEDLGIVSATPQLLIKLKQTSEILVGSKVVVLPAGHAAALELPEEFNSAVLEFLSEVKTD